jgi:hypothetical protein
VVVEARVGVEGGIHGEWRGFARPAAERSPGPEFLQHGP